MNRPVERQASASHDHELELEQVPASSSSGGIDAAPCPGRVHSQRQETQNEVPREERISRLQETRLQERPDAIEENIQRTRETPGTIDENNVIPGFESERARIERLGRERPPQFHSLLAEIGFCFSISMSQVLAEYFVSGFNVVLPSIVTKLNIPSESSTWPASAFSLVISSFLLGFGRLADMHGGYPAYVLGFAWMTVWSVIAGFSQNALMLNFCRALQGLGPASFLVSGLMLLGSIYRPGPRKNVVFSIYGACAPLGFFAGIFFAGLCGQYLTWRWYFWIGACLCAITTVAAYFAIPSDVAERRALGIKMDWYGAILIFAGLVLVVFAITDSSHAPRGWATPYIFVTFVVGALLLAVAVYVEGWVAEHPLVPPDLFRIPYMKPLAVTLFLMYGCLGVYLFYATFYMETIMGATPLQVVAWCVPMALGGCIISTVGGFFLHLVPGTILIIVAGIAWTIAPLLFAIAPAPHANYWAYVFPSMICATLAVDITYSVTNIFISTNMPKKRQGLAGAFINSVLYLGISFLLGFADITAAQTSSSSSSSSSVSSSDSSSAAKTGTVSAGETKAYKSVFWFEMACAATALVVAIAFVRITEAKSDMTFDEKEAEKHAEKDVTAVDAGAMQEQRRRVILQLE
ncbi:MFS general substrate transporter [Xylona heveae TC161]|uniref:MFS general substrate transporter n=1 Tax=Xylona heveae (strain CBS 132557 / TC161) TaxID=1328760 RepID=A0A165IS10_XYLHT|nr:MFS general substrate transporter [Xylona heveae TC161]KZF25302.1 MFS general substrate transporter [Xylona heveae TC161]